MNQIRQQQKALRIPRKKTKIYLRNVGSNYSLNNNFKIQKVGTINILPPISSAYFIKFV